MAKEAASIEDDLDLTAEEAPSRSLSPPATPSYDPAPQRERLRGWLAIALVAILASVVVYSGLVLWANKMPIDDLKSFLELVFTPLIALVGSVIGFYYGGKSN